MGESLQGTSASRIKPILQILANGVTYLSQDKQWITAEVELPQELIEAHAEGRLVFFVGAGASKAPPSSLPLFAELADRLGHEAGYPLVESSDGVAPMFDHFLGQLCDLKPPYPVHARTREILSDPASKPNRWHETIMRLASAYGKLRVVTTNFDDHLAQAAINAGIVIPDRWSGPALPLADSFVGLVHLHGSVTRSPNELVLTDKDLGKAYMSDAWALRFVDKLFRSNVVVFIGYGLTDPTMRYLTLGLESGSSLYAFTRTSESSNQEWDRLGVKTIPFGEDFDNVPQALEAWNTRARMGNLEHELRIAELVSGYSILSPVDNDYLMSCLNTPEGAREFVRAVGRLTDEAQIIGWLQWLEPHPTFRSLFEVVETSDTARILSSWFTRTFVASPNLNATALRTIMNLGQRLSTELFQDACYWTEELYGEDPVAAERWRALLSSSIIGQTAPVPSESLLDAGEGQLVSTTILRTLLRPYLRLKKRWILTDEAPQTLYPDVDVLWPIREEYLSSQLHSAVEIGPAGDQILGGILESTLISAYELYYSYYGDSSFDSFSFRRSSITEHEQDRYREPLDAIIDALRDYGRKALQKHGDLPTRWWEIGYALFQRLALYLVSHHPLWSADEKLSWLLARTDLYPRYLKHELFELLALTISSASEETWQKVLEEALIGPKLAEDIDNADIEYINKLSEYSKYNLMVWIVRHAPTWIEAQSALYTLQENNPSFEPRPNPDFDSWSSDVSYRGESLPFSLEDFTQFIIESASGALEALVSHDYDGINFDEPRWDDALSLVRQVAQNRPELGVDLWRAVDVSVGVEQNKSNQIRNAIITGWGKAELGDYGETVIQCVLDLDAYDVSAFPVGKFLLEQVEKLIDSPETSVTAYMRTIAKKLWDTQKIHFTHNANNPLSGAPLYLNSWPGYLTQYWIHEIDRRWRTNRVDWNGLNKDEQSAIISLLDGSRAALDAIQPALTLHLFFLFQADSVFTTERILPLFTEDYASRFAWSSYLNTPRWSERLLSAGFFDIICGQWDWLGQLADRAARGQFYLLVLSILSWAGINEDSRNVLLTKSVTGSNGLFAAEFAEEIVRYIGRNPTESGQIWDRWLRRHITNRFKGIPRIASEMELAQWADIVPYLEDAIPEGVALFEECGIGLSEHWHAPEIPARILDSHGEMLVNYFTERIANTVTPFPLAMDYSLRQLKNIFLTRLSERDVQPLLEAARIRGFIES